MLNTIENCIIIGEIDFLWEYECKSIETLFCFVVMV